jgi:heme-degrading monooxygenase HmoA
MPEIPWTPAVGAPDLGAECTIVAACLPLRSYGDLPWLRKWTKRVRHQLETAPGLVGHALDLRVLDKTLWVVSAWNGRADLARFESSGAHLAAKRMLRAAMLPTTLAVWSAPTDELPISWDEVRRRVAEAQGATPPAE